MKLHELTEHRLAMRQPSLIPFLVALFLSLTAPSAGACEKTLPPAALKAEQEKLLDALLKQLRGLEEENKVGQRSFDEILYALNEYWDALAVQQQMEACARVGKPVLDAELRAIRINTSSTHLKILQSWREFAEVQLDIAEIWPHQAAFVKAAALTAEIRLAALNHATCAQQFPSAKLLPLQKALVEALNSRRQGIIEEYNVGRRTTLNVLEAIEIYYRELEAQRVMELCASGNEPTSEKAVLKVQMATTSELLQVLRDLSVEINGRFNVGEVTTTDVASVSAAAYKAEIKVKTLQLRILD